LCFCCAWKSASSTYAPASARDERQSAASQPLRGSSAVHARSAGSTHLVPQPRKSLRWAPPVQSGQSGSSHPLAQRLRHRENRCTRGSWGHTTCCCTRPLERRRPLQRRLCPHPHCWRHCVLVELWGVGGGHACSHRHVPADRGDNQPPHTERAALTTGLRQPRSLGAPPTAPTRARGTPPRRRWCLQQQQRGRRVWEATGTFPGLKGGGRRGRGGRWGLLYHWHPQRTL
jgi:hypothetical protein